VGGPEGKSGWRSKIKPISVWYLRIIYWIYLDKTDEMMMSIYNTVYTNEDESPDNEDNRSFIDDVMSLTTDIYV
jgi:hypothetical protein